jgi:DUF1365 family protein
VARIDYDDHADGPSDDLRAAPLLQTSVSGQLHDITPALLARAFWGFGLMTLAVVLRIHWQALKLWAKRVPFVPKPPAPTDPVTR